MTTSNTPAPRMPKGSSSLLKTIHKFMDNNSVISIETIEQRDNALALTKLVKSYAKDLETLRTSIVKPMNDKVNGINAYFKTQIKPLTDFELKMKTNLLSFEKMLKQKEDEQKAIQLAAQLAMDTKAILNDEVFVELPKVKTEIALNGIRNEYSGDVNDKKSFILWCLANDKLDFLDVNQGLLNKHIASVKGECSINGVKINVEQNIHIRTK